MFGRARSPAAGLKDDASEAFLQFTCGNIRWVRLNRRFDAVISLFHVISYQTTNHDVTRAFETARSHLKEEGVFIFKGKQIGEGRLDFLIDGRLITELKAVDTLAPIHKAQVISYLKAMDLQLGLLINFNTTLLKEGIQRIVLTT